VLFTQPLSVGNGTLDSSNFILRASSIPLFIGLAEAAGIFFVVVAYLFSMTTELGKNLMEFLHIYVLLIFSSTVQPIDYRSLYLGLILLPPGPALQGESIASNDYILLCLSLPLAVLYLLAFVGFIVKKWAPRKRSVLGNVLYE
jgi:hypothetical protein